LELNVGLLEPKVEGPGAKFRLLVPNVGLLDPNVGLLEANVLLVRFVPMLPMLYYKVGYFLFMPTKFGFAIGFIGFGGYPKLYLLLKLPGFKFKE